MGMLMRRHYAKATEPAAPEEPTEELEDSEESGSAPEGSEVTEDGTEGSPESTEPAEVTLADGTEAPKDEDGIPVLSVVDAPGRGASKQVWLDYYTATNREIVEGASRDDLAEAVLGPKG